MGGCEQTKTYLWLFLIPRVHHGRAVRDSLNPMRSPPWKNGLRRDRHRRWSPAIGTRGVIERCRPVFFYPDVWLVIPANAIRRRPRVSCPTTPPGT